ncbi:WcbI family polysaccharide biosynthesis putative acetyltransferase [Siccirubricoccus phaeus]|uniref:WcbI family polysaccharide biosynthesis putative acetyltransferase n=1 Tax=Siccirubricoccus phaeus TaxID=2595053 RepID=UPI0011F286C9|nr:WcbI family polysaccharide biosynthesis putative acetyltransferase [Siccirubricoccus phaeus]
MRIAVLGGCQAHGVAHGLLALLPEAEVESFEAVVIRHHGQEAEVAAALSGYDLVFTQDLDPEFGPLGTAALQAAHPRLRRFPLIAFTGYQPDLVYLKKGGDVRYSPIGAYHSAIVAGAYSLGVPEADVAQLFNRLVYQRLGYFDAFGKARTLLLRMAQESYGLDLTAEFARWHARGCFMHTNNHPKAVALAGMATVLAIAAGLVPEGTPAPELIFDHLAIDTIWPVYPELAEPLGVPGSLLFKRLNRGIGAGANSQIIGLPRLIRESYAMYPDMPPEYFTIEEAGPLREKLAEIL